MPLKLSPLKLSTLDDSTACAELLLAHSPEAQVMQADHEGKTALMAAAQEGHMDRALLLLKFRGEDQVKAQDEDGWTALAWAARRGNTEVMRLLLAAGDPASQNLDRALRELCEFSCDEEEEPSDATLGCIKLLLSLGASLPRTDSDLMAVLQPIIQEAFQLAAVPGRVNEAVLEALCYSKRP
jgi:hypothetical protein